MTTPITTSSSVEPNSHLSMPTRLATLGSVPQSNRGQGKHQLPKDAAAVLVVVKLVEAGAGRRQQHDIARGGGLKGLADRALDGAGAQQGRRSLDLRGDLIGGGADQVGAPGAGTQQRVEDRVVAALVLASQDNVDVAGEGFQGLHRGVNIGGF